MGPSVRKSSSVVLPLLLLLPPVVLVLLTWAHGVQANPSLRNKLTHIGHVNEGENALLTCVVQRLGNHTVLWKRFEGRSQMEILTAARERVTSDQRFTVLHDKGGDVWVLAVREVKPEDAGVYVCEVNSDPPLRTFHPIEVHLKNGSVVKGVGNNGQIFVDVTEAPKPRSTHNYTSCCINKGVKERCMGFCAINNILEGSAGIYPEACEDQFPNIVRCMADYRNHVPCCQKERIPDICQDLCRGDYTIQEDNIQAHFSCTAYTEATLLCISEGIELLPPPPSYPTVRVTGPNSIVVEWEHAYESVTPPEHYIVNITTLRRFNAPWASNEKPGNTSFDLDSGDDFVFLPKRRQIKVSASQTRTEVRTLSPLTWYEVSVISENRHGSSLPTYRLRILTHGLDDIPRNGTVQPELPDVVGCCIDQGVKHQRCLNNLCNPTNNRIDEPDMIVCAPWAKEAFSCMADGHDHSECCAARGLPDVCVELCTGNVTTIDFKYFRCVDYFSDYRSCLMKGYGVLPGSPMKVRVTMVDTTYALLQWNPPDQLGESVTSYHAYFRPLKAGPQCTSDWMMDSINVSYRGIYTEHTNYVLEDLCSDTDYEFYIQAFNKHGASDPSERILFHTMSIQEEKNLNDNAYNVSFCCQSVGVSPVCMSLCDYNAKMSQARALASTCAPELSKLLRCAVGGRNHVPCCARRGVPFTCLSLCTGTFTSDQATPAVCLPYIGNIMMCLEEGIGVLPGPVAELHVTDVGDDSVTLVWEGPDSGPNVTSYQVHYQPIEKTSASQTSYKLNFTMNTTDSSAVIKGLKTGQLYKFFVVSQNEEGTSLPSSVLTINVTDDSHNGTAIAAVASAPHSLQLESKSARTLTIVWQPPELAHPTDRFRFRVHFQAMDGVNNETDFNVTETSSTALRFEKLTPNTQYVIYITCLNDKGESRPSETLLAWTDPAYPAFVETPTVHPINLIVEGKSMTVLCIAMGSPPPTVSLYISGILVHQDVTRHMVTVVHNVSRTMNEISCYADNGYGTPMQASRTITISRRPQIEAKLQVQAISGRSVTLECDVNAWPKPSMVWWRDPEGRVPVIHGGNFNIETIDGEEEGVYKHRLTIKSAEVSNSGQYYCNARNTFGHFTYTIKLQVTPAVKIDVDVTECCRKQNVSAACIDACAFNDLNFESAMNRDECIPEFEKLMFCASDGSDHRACCTKWGVPDQCREWCRGEKVEHHLQCMLQWAPGIFSCFNEGKESLPGPPTNVKVEIQTDTTALITWEPPAKNPDTVEKYRVFWRRKGFRVASMNETTQMKLEVSNLTPGKTYEVAVKAGNTEGASHLAPTIEFEAKDPYIIPTPTTKGSVDGVGVAVGVVLVVILLAVGGVAGVWWGRKRKLAGGKSSGNGISFENPSYIREQNGDTVQIAETPNGSLNGTITPGMNGGVSSTTTGGVTTDVNGGLNLNWNGISPSTPGFEDTETPSNGGYKRFSS